MLWHLVSSFIAKAKDAFFSKSTPVHMLKPEHKELWQRFTDIGDLNLTLSFISREGIIWSAEKVENRKKHSWDYFTRTCYQVRCFDFGFRKSGVLSMLPIRCKIRVYFSSPTEFPIQSC